jgi:hypothetical protein
MGNFLFEMLMLFLKCFCTDTQLLSRWYPLGIAVFFKQKIKRLRFLCWAMPSSQGIPEVTGPQPLSLGAALFWERPYPRALTYTK